MLDDVDICEKYYQGSDRGDIVNTNFAKVGAKSCEQ